jgi:hypothetical protein
MENLIKYFCGIYVNQYQMITSIHLVDVNEDITYNGSLKIGYTHFKGFNTSIYSKIIPLEKKIFEKALNMNFNDIYQKKINLFLLKNNFEHWLI